MPKPNLKVISQGCAANFGEGEKIARLLQDKYNVSFGFFDKEGRSGSADNDDKKSSNAKGYGDTPVDAYILNVCTVKGNASAIKLLRQARENSPEAAIYVTGCAPKDLKLEVARIDPGVVFTSLTELSKGDGPIKAGSPIVAPTVLRESPLVGIVNIEEGCLDACAYCSTRLVKGRLRSFPASAIVEQVKQLVHDGCKEIQLTGQDCGCYGFDFGEKVSDSVQGRQPRNLAELVQKILVEVGGDYRIRLGMGNPRHILQYIEALLECFQDDRVYKFIHLPVQSGSERTLQNMNRKHTAQDYITLTNEFNKRFSLFTLSTDLIVGFPGETELDFADTLQVLRETRPTVCNITRFVSRPGTPASRMEGTVPDVVKHKRSAELAAVFQQIAAENNARWIGQTEQVTVEKDGYRKGTLIARNDAYRPVAIQDPGTKMIPPGTRLTVKITGAEPFALLGNSI
ncbi:MAG: MiaB/RimO family radical SAM methylthiotransferase [Fibrobacter sp.]|nr:MiaB/RimO family radical SAM methylthiotransferase [Fibrobacter sp.]